MLAAAINHMVAQNETITESPKDCEDSGVLWDSGKMIFQYLKTRNIRGMTGQVAFDDNGDRINAEYEVVNTREGKNKTVIGRFFYHEVRNSIVQALTKILVNLVVLQEGKKMVLNINDSQILWPGKLKRKPEGIIIPTHLKVLTIEEKPFIYVRRLGIDEPDCDPKDEVPCPMFNATDGTGEWTQINGFLLSVKP